jgi:hypothetical protein
MDIPEFILPFDKGWKGQCPRVVVVWCLRSCLAVFANGLISSSLVRIILIGLVYATQWTTAPSGGEFLLQTGNYH